MKLSFRQRYAFFALISVLLICTTTFYLRPDAFGRVASIIPYHGDEPSPPAEAPPPPPPPPKKPKYKDPAPILSRPIVENFPLAFAAHSAADLPPIPSWVRPPVPHVKESTPLLIGFTRNWRLLQQTVVSYITAGWPPEDIYVVENTGVMNSNAEGLLSLQNPFFLNHTRLNMFGVNIVVTPTLLTFAQLQNYFLHTALQKGWDHYFWSHMDVVVIPYEDRYVESHPELKPESSYSDFSSLYMNCVKELRKVTDPGADPKWGLRFFHYDHLALVNVKAYMAIGGWDTLIAYYLTDCDMHARLAMDGWSTKDAEAGLIHDVASSLDDLIVLYRKQGTIEASFTDPNVVEEELKKQAEELENQGKEPIRGRFNMEERSALQPSKRVPPPGEFVPASPNGAAIPSEWKDDTVGSPQFRTLADTCDKMQKSKVDSSRGRNTWQARQYGGQGEPFYRDSAGFESGLWMVIENGRAVYREKWGHQDCDLIGAGLRPEDAWKVKHDWE
ncbi:hypothetical protein F5884DRAFT_661820 [Xylogone sp. PMI_703]|nr:hypothetical protein F5884DRAFT_661820 [Xylogone sp. PMI_703]